MKYKFSYALIGILIVLSPLLILTLYYHNKLEKINNDAYELISRFNNTRAPTMEDFAASAGGALIQLASSHVASEQEVATNLRNEKKQVVRDILNMTEPEMFPGPKPGSA